MTYTPERQLFPPGTKVKAVTKRGDVYIGVVAGPEDLDTWGIPLRHKRNADCDNSFWAYWQGPNAVGDKHIQCLGYDSCTFTKLEDAPLINLPTQERTTPMTEPPKPSRTGKSIKSAAATVRDYVKPYEKYLVAAAVLLALDHFVLKGAMTDRIQRLAQSLADRLVSMVDGLIARIGGE